MSSTIGLRPVKKIVTIVCIVPMVCRVLGTTPVGDRANIFEDRAEYWDIETRTRHLLRFLQNHSLPTHAEFVASLLMLQYEQLSGRGTGNWAPSAARIFQSQFSL
jgi:hypothetical protein